MTPLDDIKKISIVEYLKLRGLPGKQTGDKWFFKSPFSRDTNWSLCVYPNNSFYDWSQGFGGSIIDLVMGMENANVGDAIRILAKPEWEKYQYRYKVIKASISKHFEYTRYLSHLPSEVASIRLYGAQRGLVNGFECGAFYTLQDGEWIRNPSIMFLHRDAGGKVVGAKFRKIDPSTPSDKDNGPRFSARGRMMYYILEYVDTDNFGQPTLYVVEGEANANSLWQYCQEIKKNCVVISFGGVGNLPDKLPEKYDYITDRKLIIDFDGSEELYQKRVGLYQEYNLQPIKMVLPKGEDINSLYCKNEMHLLNNLL